MRFIDRRVLAAKANAAAVRRNAIRDTLPDPIPGVFTFSMFFVASFFSKVSEEKNASEFLAALASANDVQLDTVMKLLTFWWFWSQDRLQGMGSLELEPVRTGLTRIWGYSEIDIDQTTQFFDSKGDLAVTSLWDMIANTLMNRQLSPVFVLPLMRNSQVEVLQMMDNLGR